MSAEAASDTVEAVQGVIECLTGVIGTGDTPNAVIATDGGTDIVQQFVDEVREVEAELTGRGSTSGGWFRGLLG